MKSDLISILVLISVIISLALPIPTYAGVDNYVVSKRADGGYTLAIRYSKRHWQPITVEGFFPLEKGICVVELKGKGKKREYKNLKGTYYGADNIGGRFENWDVGYAWIDEKENLLYLKLFWAAPPDDTIESYVNGEYDLSHTDSSDSQLIKWLQTYREKESN